METCTQTKAKKMEYFLAQEMTRVGEFLYLLFVSSNGRRKRLLRFAVFELAKVESPIKRPSQPS